MKLTKPLQVDLRNGSGMKTVYLAPGDVFLVSEVCHETDKIVATLMCVGKKDKPNHRKIQTWRVYYRDDDGLHKHLDLPGHNSKAAVREFYTTGHTRITSVKLLK